VEAGKPVGVRVADYWSDIGPAAAHARRVSLFFVQPQMRGHEYSDGIIHCEVSELRARRTCTGIIRSRYQAEA
jgi:hypothetical protein